MDSRNNNNNNKHLLPTREDSVIYNVKEKNVQEIVTNYINELSEDDFGNFFDVAKQKNLFLTYSYDKAGLIAFILDDQQLKNLLKSKLFLFMLGTGENFHNRHNVLTIAYENMKVGSQLDGAIKQAIDDRFKSLLNVAEEAGDECYKTVEGIRNYIGEQVRDIKVDHHKHLINGIAGEAKESFTRNASTPPDYDKDDQYKYSVTPPTFPLFDGKNEASNYSNYGVDHYNDDTYVYHSSSPNEDENNNNNNNNNYVNDQLNDHLMLGEYTFKCHFDKQENRLIVTRTSKNPALITHKLKTYAGVVAAVGYEDAINEAKMVIETLMEEGKKPLEIDMFGFSRGADTLLRLCNVLNKYYTEETIIINYFGIDDVAGPRRGDDQEARHVPKLIRKCVIIMTKHDHRQAFANQDKSKLVFQDLSKTKVEFNVISGDHTSLTRLTKDENGNLIRVHAVYLLTDILQEFAEENGAQLQGDLPYALREPKGRYVISNEPKFMADMTKEERRLVCYTMQIVNYKEYEDKSLKIPGVFGKRNFIERTTDYFLHGAGVFQDKQHMLLFKHKFPAYFDYFFQQGKGGSSIDQVDNDIKNFDDNLKKFCELKKLPSRVRTDKGEDLFLPADGLPFTVDSFYECKHLVMLWETCLSAFLPIISGNDKSCTKKKAREYLANVYQTITSDSSNNKKIIEIRAFIRGIALEYSNKTIAFILSGILNQQTNIAIILFDVWGNQCQTENPESLALGQVLTDFYKDMDLMEKEGMPPEERIQFIKPKIQALVTFIKEDQETSKDTKEKLLFYLDRYDKNIDSSIAKQFIDALNKYLEKFESQYSLKIATQFKMALESLISCGEGNNAQIIGQLVTRVTNLSYALGSRGLGDLINKLSFHLSQVSQGDDNKKIPEENDVVRQCQIMLRQIRKEYIIDTFFEYKGLNKEFVHGRGNTLIDNLEIDNSRNTLIKFLKVFRAEVAAGGFLIDKDFQDFLDKVNNFFKHLYISYVELPANPIQARPMPSGSDTRKRISKGKEPCVTGTPSIRAAKKKKKRESLLTQNNFFNQPAGQPGRIEQQDKILEQTVVNAELAAQPIVHPDTSKKSSSKNTLFKITVGVLVGLTIAVLIAFFWPVVVPFLGGAAVGLFISGASTAAITGTGIGILGTGGLIVGGIFSWILKKFSEESSTPAHTPNAVPPNNPPQIPLSSGYGEFEDHSDEKEQNCSFDSWCESNSGSDDDNDTQMMFQFEGTDTDDDSKSESDHHKGLPAEQSLRENDQIPSHLTNSGSYSSTSGSGSFSSSPHVMWQPASKEHMDKKNHPLIGYSRKLSGSSKD